MALLLPPCLLAQAPYRAAREQQQSYVGPGYDDPEPAEFTDVPLGFFGPAGTLFAGASLAIEDLNRAGGYKGKPFRLVSRWSDNPWRAGASAVVKLIYEDKVWAMIGGIDGATTHLAEQVVAKAWCTLMDPVSTDAGINHANVPWTFSLAPSDAVIGRALAEALRRNGTIGPTAILVETDHDSRISETEFSKALNKAGATAVRRQECSPGSPEALATAVELAGSGAANLVIFAGAAETLRLVQTIRRKSPDVTVLAGVGGTPGARGPVWCEWGARAAELSARAKAKFDCAADWRMLHAYDCVAILAAAIREGGLNRSRIRERVAAMRRWNGVSGGIAWDSYGRNERRVTVGAAVGEFEVSGKISSQEVYS